MSCDLQVKIPLDTSVSRSMDDEDTLHHSLESYLCKESALQVTGFQRLLKYLKEYTD